jgi:hypothetical protein
MVDLLVDYQEFTRTGIMVHEPCLIGWKKCFRQRSSESQNRSSVASGSEVAFNFTVTAPATPGTYNCQWRMVQDFVEWFGDFTPNVAVTVNAQPGGNPSPEPDPSTPVADVRWMSRINWGRRE